MIAFDDAQALLARVVSPLGIERIALEEAEGRFLAEPLHAAFDSPRAPVSAMDGYAVCDAATVPGLPLDVVGAAFPGKCFPAPIAAGQAVRIYTGAPLPAGADRVIAQEHATRSAGQVTFDADYGPGWHVRTPGSDFTGGACLLEKGLRLTPGALVTAASADVSHVDVHHRPVVAMIATGDELVSPGTAAALPCAIPDSLSYGVRALARRNGALVKFFRRLGDDVVALAAAAGEALEHADVVVISGGASVGDRDFAKPMFTPHGLELVFDKVAMQPGKPVWFGRARDRWVLGLPGNPTAAMVTARLFLIPLLHKLQGRTVPATEWRRLPLAASLPAVGTRELFVRAQWRPEGLLPATSQDSGAQSVLAQVDWLIRRPPRSGSLAKGALVEATPI
ncbi:molybdopterin molybdotransferase MoeA [Sphingomonas parapaucimobilis]|uniref:Molybdopterin molybdenumtransferase n=1 Tax=Sphingomonas parapaucimobilis NBRC 15100 TaxID=1219049 RepID=A0A0A1WA28_9SPHN|nr:molybdopterin molybdotransferase MoeA [Sphingomonas parapaucimobilis]GAM01831.1 molybdopterin biosynthesis protein MoeA [Sphingomonas parapaucimobilis NBRC 15100]